MIPVTVSNGGQGVLWSRLGILLGLLCFVGLCMAAAQADLLQELVSAADIGDVNRVTVVLKKGAPINGTWGPDGTTALIAAAQKGRAAVVQRLIDAHAALDTKTSDGLTALMQASQAGQEPVVKLLIAAGAEVNTTRQDGATALIGAAQNGRTEVVRDLLGAHADVQAATNVGVTALLAASLYGHVDIVRALIKAGANVNVKDGRYGATPLIMASQQGHFDVVQALIAAHADLNVKMANGQSALDLAKSQGRTQVISLLQRGGAR